MSLPDRLRAVTAFIEAQPPAIQDRIVPSVYSTHIVLSVAGGYDDAGTVAAVKHLTGQLRDYHGRAVPPHHWPSGSLLFFGARLDDGLRLPVAQDSVPITIVGVMRETFATDTPPVTAEASR